jgi:KDO2-lipid IV(A) lauroyltransferase
MRRVVRRLKEGGFVAVLIDQRAGSEGIEVPFFGIPATTFPGAAALSRLAQVSMVPVFSFREKPFKHKIYVGAPLSCAAGSRDEEIGALMTEANLVLEKLIRRYPAQWLWLHRRWP